MSASSYFSGFAIGLSVGLFWGRALASVPRDQDPDFRRSFNHENIKRPSGPPPLKLRRSSNEIRLDPGHVQRGHGNGAPATSKPTIIPKPHFPPRRSIQDNFL